MKNFLTTSLFLICIYCNGQRLVFKPHNDSPWSLDFSGYVQADVIVDNKKLTYIDGYYPTYMESNQTDYNTYITMRQTLVGVGINNNDAGLRGYVEFNFIGPNNQTQFNLRKIYLTYKNWLIGQDWSTLNDLGTWPNLLDFNGPNAALYARRIQIKYLEKISSKIEYAFSLEDPNTPSLTLPENDFMWKKNQIFPNVVGAFKYGAKSYIRGAAILSPISYKRNLNLSNDMQKMQTTLGYGIHASSLLYTNALSNFKLVAAAGSGIATNVISFWEEGYDAVVDPNNPTRLQKLPVYSGVAAYEHWWNNRWSSVLFYSYSNVGKGKYMEKNQYKTIQHFGINTIYQPTSYFKTGFDFTYGFVDRYQVSTTFESARLQLSTAFIF
ncbi:hypothetical protein K5I29_07800 [Flavobacterium agricola]|uniref:Porin n=1 Tax=Flavobacterium agricola TaxID=2870839 RepID=A0ABY6LY37_9FLAO|nr:DcaP family trimeric outer membrane transporter [Flavobacterium agricola]UYW00462.1 hypothetical protein K5I29_07800 [Flavobacterium agricola]